MRYPELLYGSGDPKTIPVSKTPLDLSDGSNITIENAEIFYTLYELKMSIAQAILPRAFIPVFQLFSVLHSSPENTRQLAPSILLTLALLAVLE